MFFETIYLVNTLKILNTKEKEAGVRVMINDT